MTKKLATVVELDLNNIPKVNYNMTYGSVPANFYERSEMQRLITENAEIKKYIYETTGRRWGDDLGPGKYSTDGKKFSPLDVNERKIGQLQVCMNVMANCISEYVGHLKKCALPYMEAYSKDDKEQIALHHQAYMPNHVKSIITFQKYIETVMKDAELSAEEFEKKIFAYKENPSLEDELEASYKMHYQTLPEIELERLMKERNVRIPHLTMQNNQIAPGSTSDIRAQPIRMPVNEELD
jgi:hypothetical protein